MDARERITTTDKRGAKKMSPAIRTAAFCVSAPFLLFANDLNTGGQAGIVRTLSAFTLGKNHLNIGGAFKYATDAEYVKGPDGTKYVVRMQGLSATTVTDADPAQLLSGNIFAAYGLTSILDIGADLPIYEDITGWGPKSNGVGDLELSAKLKYPYQVPGTFIAQAYYLNMIFPTGRKSQGFFPRHSYYIKSDPDNTGLHAFSVDAVFVNPMLLWTFDFSRLSRNVPLLFHVNFGGVIAQAKSSSTVMAALALEARPLPYLTLFTELTGESRVKYYIDSFSVASFNNDPFRLSTGFRLNLPHGLYCIIADDIGFSDGRDPYRANWNRHGYLYSTRAIPTWSAQINIGWNGLLMDPSRDRDKDGIPDRIDKCPNEPEDRDGFEDSDGCPDYDNDLDGVFDMFDKCPNDPEDKDGFEDRDGCPDYDNDKDGIPDSIDKCPNQPEDLDGFQDADGCPDSRASVRSWRSIRRPFPAAASWRWPRT